MRELVKADLKVDEVVALAGAGGGLGRLVVRFTKYLTFTS